MFVSDYYSRNRPFEQSLGRDRNTVLGEYFALNRSFKSDKATISFARPKEGPSTSSG
jgi:hypothetical protein